MASENQSPNAASEQPTVAPYTREELRKACGRTIAFVLALGDEPSDGLRPAIQAALDASMPAVFVFADPNRAVEATEVVRTTAHRKNVILQAFEYDPSIAATMTYDAGTFELFDLPYGLVATAHAVAQSALDEYDSIVLIDDAQAQVSSNMLYELCCDAKTHPEIDAMALSAETQPFPPYYIAGSFLDQLEKPDANNASETENACVLKANTRIHTIDAMH